MSDKSTIILQTDRYRVSHKPGHKSTDVGTVIIEERRHDTQGEAHWGKLTELWKHGTEMTDFHHLINHLFDNLADHRKRNANIDSPVLPYDVVEASERHAADKIAAAGEQQPPWIEKARLNKMAAALRDLIGCIRAEGVTIEQDMPFHDARLSIGIQLSPGLEDDLHKLFPGHPYPLMPFQLVCKLFERMAEFIDQKHRA